MPPKSGQLYQILSYADSSSLRTADASAATPCELSSGPIWTPSRPSSRAGQPSSPLDTNLFGDESGSSGEEDSLGNPKSPHGPSLPPSSSHQETGSPTPTRDASMAVDEGTLLVPTPLTLFRGVSMELNAEAVAHSLREAVDFLSVYTVLLDGPAPLLSISQSLMRLGALCLQDRWGHLPAVNWEGNQSNVYDCVLPMFVTQTEAPLPLTESAPVAAPMVEDPPPPAPPFPAAGTRSGAQPPQKGKQVLRGPPPPD
jgi:hypothetical protein